MLKILDQAYLDMDPYLDLEDLPRVDQAVAESFDLIKQNSWQRVIDLSGETVNCTWSSKQRGALTPKSVFSLEVQEQVLAPMWILNLTEDRNTPKVNCYDSLKTPPQEWENIVFRNDLSPSWKPFIEWVQNIKVFSTLGRVSIIIGRPGVPVFYHRDSGEYDESFTSHPHRQEFIWVRLSEDKRIFILDSDLTPHRISSKAAFFNHHNWHGSHESYPKWTFSCKIEGIFSEAFRRKSGLDKNHQYGE